MSVWPHRLLFSVGERKMKLTTGTGPKWGRLAIWRPWDQSGSDSNGRAPFLNISVSLSSASVKPDSYSDLGLINSTPWRPQQGQCSHNVSARGKLLCSRRHFESIALSASVKIFTLRILHKQQHRANKEVLKLKLLWTKTPLKCPGDTKWLFQFKSKEGHGKWFRNESRKHLMKI